MRDSLDILSYYRFSMFLFCYVVDDVLIPE